MPAFERAAGYRNLLDRASWRTFLMGSKVDGRRYLDGGDYVLFALLFVIGLAASLFLNPYGAAGVWLISGIIGMTPDGARHGQRTYFMRHAPGGPIIP